MIFHMESVMLSFLGLGLLWVLLTCDDFVDFGALGSIWYGLFQVLQPLKLTGNKKSMYKSTHLSMKESNLDGASDGDIGIPFSHSFRKPHRVTARKGVYDFNATLPKQWLLQKLATQLLPPTSWFDQISLR